MWPVNDKKSKNCADRDTDLILENDRFFSQTIIERSKNPVEFWKLKKLPQTSWSCSNGFGQQLHRVKEFGQTPEIMSQTANKIFHLWIIEFFFFWRRVWKYDHSVAPNFIALTELNWYLIELQFNKANWIETELDVFFLNCTWLVKTQMDPEVELFVRRFRCLSRSVTSF